MSCFIFVFRLIWLIGPEDGFFEKKCAFLYDSA